MLTYYTYFLIGSFLEPTLLNRRFRGDGTLFTLEGAITTGLVIFICLFVLALIQHSIEGYKKKQRSASPKISSKAISEKAVDKALSKNQRIFIGTQYFEGISHFTKDCAVILELMLDELRITSTKSACTASLPFSRILGADMMELPNRSTLDLPDNTAVYFVIDYLNVNGEQQRIIFGEPAFITNYALFMAVLERRVPIIAASKAAATLEAPKHIDL